MKKVFLASLLVLLSVGARAEQLYLPNLGLNATGTTSAGKHLLDVNIASGTISFTESATVANGGALPALTKVVSGYDGSNVRVIKTDAGGAVQVDVESSALPTGAATEATLSTLNGKVTAVNTGAVVVSSSALPTGASTEATLSTLNGKVTAVNTGAVVVSSSALPSGASTAAKQPALGTAGTASADVITVQGIASMTALLVTATPKTPAALTVKQAALTVGTSAVRLTNDAGAPPSTRVLLVAQLLSTSTANCFFGSSGVTTTSTTRGVQMFPGQTLSFTLDAGDYYAICDASSQTIFITEQE